MCLRTIREMDKNRWHILAATFLGNLCEGYNAVIYVLCLFPIISELTKSSDHAVVGPIGSIVLAIFMLGWAVGGVLFGVIADRFGRVSSLAISIFVYAIFTGVSVFAQTWQEFGVCRFLVGCGAGGEISVSATLLAESLHGRAKTHALGFMVTAIALGQILAAAINSLGLGWRWTFAIGTIPALIALYVRLALRDSSSANTTSLAKTASQFTLLTPVHLITIAWLSILTSVAIVQSWIIPSWIPTWLNQLTGSEATQQISILMAVLTCASLVSCLTTSMLVIRLGAIRAIQIGMVGASILWVVFYAANTTFGPAMLCWGILADYFCVLPGTALCILIPDCFPERIRATAFGLSFMLGRLLAAGFALAGAQLLSMFHGSYVQSAIVLSIACLGGIVATFCLQPDRGPKNC